MNLTFKLLAMLLASLTLIACASTKPRQASYSDYIEPLMKYSTIDQTNRFYDFDKVRVEIAPEQVKHGEMVYKVALRDVGEPMFGYILAKADISPGRKETADVTLAITIQNQMDRILRLQSSIVSLIVNDKRVTTGPLKVDDPAFNDQTILPKRSETLYLHVPDVTRFGTSGKIELSIYDLPVDISPSGEVLKRENLIAVYEYHVEENRLPVINDTVSIMLPQDTIRNYRKKGLYTEREILRDIYGHTDL